MYRIRFHGRGGDGMKTAGRILGTAFFLQGYEVQDAPRYGAERRGAPVFAYMRASGKRINERGIIRTPDLVVIADDSLFAISPDTLFEGVKSRTVIIASTSAKTESLQPMVPAGTLLTIPRPGPGHAASLSTICAAAAAGITGVITPAVLEQALREELAALDPPEVGYNVKTAIEIFNRTAGSGIRIQESAEISIGPPAAAAWIDLPFHDTYRSTPAIRAPGTSVLNRTGTWRTLRPSVDMDNCSRCMLCALYCPDSAISADAKGFPLIDYDHCKGCMICSWACPKKAIKKVPEHSGQEGRR